MTEKAMVWKYPGACYHCEHAHIDSYSTPYYCDVDGRKLTVDEPNRECWSPACIPKVVKHCAFCNPVGYGIRWNVLKQETLFKEEKR